MGTKDNRGAAVKCERTWRLPKEFEAVEIETHPSFEKDS